MEGRKKRRTEKEKEGRKEVKKEGGKEGRTFRMRPESPLSALAT